MVQIISRAGWGARPWQPLPATVPASERTEFVVHWHGASKPQPGPGMCKVVERIHMDEHGWAGVGYAYLVDRAGRVFEGRGWDLQGAHCTGYNRSGVGIYVGIGAGEEPPAVALGAVRWLHGEACQHFGRGLTATWHGALIPTDCPGPALTAWVRAGMPIDQPPPEESSMPTVDEISAEVWGPGSTYVIPLAAGGKGEVALPDGRSAVSPVTALARAMYGVEELLARVGVVEACLQRGAPVVLSQSQVDAIADAVAARVPSVGGAAADPQVLARAVVAELGAALTTSMPIQERPHA